MATAKQLAWRKKFAALAKAGKLRKKNPAKKKPAVKRAKKSISSPSQITKRAPTKRLKTRRAANTKPGYFPNPTKVPGFGIVVQILVKDKWVTVAGFRTPTEAKEYATALHRKTPSATIRVYSNK